MQSIFKKLYNVFVKIYLLLAYYKTIKYFNIIKQLYVMNNPTTNMPQQTLTVHLCINLQATNKH